MWRVDWSSLRAFSGVVLVLGAIYMSHTTAEAARPDTLAKYNYKCPPRCGFVVLVLNHSSSTTRANYWRTPPLSACNRLNSFDWTNSLDRFT
jgi:hypothetical protein